jgi:hypothetical protein
VVLTERIDNFITDGATIEHQLVAVIELPPVPNRFAGQSTNITAQEDRSSTSYKWKVGTVLFRVTAIDSAQRHAQAFIESIRPLKQQTFIDLVNSLTTEPPPYLQY